MIRNVWVVKAAYIDCYSCGSDDRMNQLLTLIGDNWRLSLVIFQSKIKASFATSERFLKNRIDIMPRMVG